MVGFMALVIFWGGYFSGRDDYKLDKTSFLTWWMILITTIYSGVRVSLWLLSL